MHVSRGVGAPPLCALFAGDGPRSASVGLCRACAPRSARWRTSLVITRAGAAETASEVVSVVSAAEGAPIVRRIAHRRRPAASEAQPLLEADAPACEPPSAAKFTARFQVRAALVAPAQPVVTGLAGGDLRLTRAKGDWWEGSRSLALGRTHTFGLQCANGAPLLHNTPRTLQPRFRTAEVTVRCAWGVGGPGSARVQVACCNLTISSHRALPLDAALAVELLHPAAQQPRILRMQRGPGDVWRTHAVAMSLGENIPWRLVEMAPPSSDNLTHAATVPEPGPWRTLALARGGGGVLDCAWGDARAEMSRQRRAPSLEDALLGCEMAGLLRASPLGASVVCPPSRDARLLRSWRCPVGSGERSWRRESQPLHAARLLRADLLLTLPSLCVIFECDEDAHAQAHYHGSVERRRMRAIAAALAAVEQPRPVVFVRIAVPRALGHSGFALKREQALALALQATANPPRLGTYRVAYVGYPEGMRPEDVSYADSAR